MNPNQEFKELLFSLLTSPNVIARDKLDTFFDKYTIIISINNKVSDSNDPTIESSSST